MTMEKRESNILYSIMGAGALIGISVLAFFLTNIYNDFRDVAKSVLKIEKNLELLQFRNDIKEQKLNQLEVKIDVIEEQLKELIVKGKQNEKIRKSK